MTFKRVKPDENEDQLSFEPIDTSITNNYMFNVSMVVHVIAPTKELARLKLDQEGGYVSKRVVEFVRSVELYKDEPEED
jgi:hypothetical protein